MSLTASPGSFSIKLMCSTGARRYRREHVRRYASSEPPGSHAHSSSLPVGSSRILKTQPPDSKRHADALLGYPVSVPLGKYGPVHSA
jgi:hypothetical protein